jgi:hypothetical protein
MIILNPGSLHSFLDFSDYTAPGDSVSGISNNPAVLS